MMRRDVSGGKDQDVSEDKTVEVGKKSKKRKGRAYWRKMRVEAENGIA